jgi:hypothetical protein
MIKFDKWMLKIYLIIAIQKIKKKKKLNHGNMGNLYKQMDLIIIVDIKNNPPLRNKNK